jgi:diphthine synthase
MLWFIGIGINGYCGISLHALDIMKSCNVIYIDTFTSELNEKDIEGLKSIVGENNNRRICIVQRWLVEDGRIILEQSRDNNIALVTYGDPLIATTHMELYVRAVRNFIKTDIIHAASGITSLISETGLHMYKFGRSVTLMLAPQSAITVYNTISDNLLFGNHTLILTEYNNNDTPFFLDPSHVLRALLETENNLKYNILSKETFVIVGSRIGTEYKKIMSGKVKSLIDTNFGVGPHSVIVSGSLHFTESDALKTLTHNIDTPVDNTLNLERVSVSMVKKYAPKAKKALEQMKNIIMTNNSSVNHRSTEILDNAECYIYDAERFLGQGKLELAVLSIGYAEGIIDAISFQMGINPWFS